MTLVDTEEKGTERDKGIEKKRQLGETKENGYVGESSIVFMMMV